MRKLLGAIVKYLLHPPEYEMVFDDDDPRAYRECIRWIALRFHRHDYEMVFDDSREDPFAYKLVCRCGDVAPNMHIAMRRMQPWYARWYGATQ